MRRLLDGLALAATVAASVTFVVAGLLGVRLLPVLTGSMTPYAPTGSLVLTLPAAGGDVRVGDVIAFRPPAPYEVVGGHPVLHRAVQVGATGSVPWVVTRGDANAAQDPWQVDLRGADVGRAVLVVPHVGRAVAGGAWSTLPLLLGAATLAVAWRLLRTPPHVDHPPSGCAPRTTTPVGGPEAPG